MKRSVRHFNGRYVWTELYKIVRFVRESVRFDVNEVTWITWFRGLVYVVSKRCDLVVN